MYDCEEVVGQVRKYLESIGVPKTVLDDELNDVKAILVLHLPAVCILKENRASTSKQTHIHVTGDGMRFFFDKDDLVKNPRMFSSDVKEDIILFRDNLIDLEDIAVRRNGVAKENLLRSESDMISSFTVKKVGRVDSPNNIQVQISKLRLDDKWFIHLRKCLFQNDVLVFIKTGRREADLVVGIPYSYAKDNSIHNTVIFANPKLREDDIISKESEEVFSTNSNLRSVDFGSIAKFKPVDEEDETISSFTDLTASIQTRKKRTERHHDIVKLIALDLERKGYSLYENPIDCLAVKENKTTLLFEVKTLDGSDSDEKKQVQKAFSQLFYYEMFSVKDFKENGLEKFVVFEKQISDEHINFFEQVGIKVIWVNENKHVVGKDGVIEF